MGFHVTHLYGLTECYGPATVCLEQPELGRPADRGARALRWRARACATRRWRTSRCSIPTRWRRCRADGATIGELMLRGNTVMKGYLKNPRPRAEASRGGWFHTGDLA